VILVAIAGGCNYLLPGVYNESLFYFFSVAIFASAIFGGLGPGLLATALSAFANAYLLISPFQGFRIEPPEMAQSLAIFVVEGAMISTAGHVVRESRTPELASTWSRYACGVLLVAGAVVLKILLFPSLERRVPFTFFYSAVVATAWLGGAAPGLEATVLSAACAYFLFIRPRPYSFPGHPGLVLFGVEATALCLLTTMFRQRLLKTEAYLGRVFEHSPSGILIVDGEARILNANPAFERMLDTDKVRLQGRPFIELVHPNSHERARTLLDHLLQHQTVDGMEEISLVGSKTIAWATIRGSWMPDDGHHVPVFVLMLEDITERRKTEEALRQIETRLERGQRVEAIGMFAGGIAHDFNNLLAIIFGCCERLLTLKDLPAGPRAYADEILETAKSAADLTRQLLTFARRQPQDDQIIDVNRVVAEAVDMLRRLVGSRIKLETELAPDVGQVRADPSRLHQVLMNLAANARDAMPSGGRLTIRTSLTDVASSTMGIARLPAVQHVTLQVTDTGCGMDEATRAHIFEPLFSTKDLEKGTGLGLATVQSIVTKLGGVISVESSPGNGARFLIHLPRVGPELQRPWQTLQASAEDRRPGPQ
jgi:PAS domain S-box-containing protein